MEETGGIPFKPEVHEISIEKIKVNPLNPRRRFSESMEDELLASMDSKGIINPIIVFERGTSYYLVDGQRRFEAAKRLKIERIPARVLEREPSELENLSMMFHVHNVAKNWTDMAIALTIENVMGAIGTKNVKQISKITSLSEYKIRKYLKILKFPKRVRDKFVESEKKEKPDLDVDFLTEIYTPIQRMKKVMPDLIQRYPVGRIVNICVAKKRSGIIQSNKEFRDLGRIVSNAKEGRIDKEVAEEKIAGFFENRDVTIERVYSETSKAIDQAIVIGKTCLRLTDDIRNIDLRRIPDKDRKDLESQLRTLMESIKMKIE